ncbi:reverse transcriptase domain-containing protein [Tanacetum coccineum]
MQIQAESDVAMTKRRHGNHAVMQVVLIPKANVSLRCQVSGPLVCQSHTSVLTKAPRSNRSKNLLQQIGAIRRILFPNYLEFRMTGPTPEPITPDQSLSLQDQILNHVSSLETLIKQHNEKSGALITPIRLTFGEEADGNKGKDKEKGVVEVGDDLKKPYKEVLESPFTRRIIEFSALSHRMPTNLRIYDGSTDPDDHISRFVRAANEGEWEMPVWCRMFQQTLDGPTRGWFDQMPNGCIDSWANLRERFIERFALRRRCSKDPTEVSKIVRRANETLPNFKERWTEEMGYIQGVPEVMQISAFMSNSKCPELARRFADQVPQTVTEMMKRVDDFVKSEEAFKSTELPRGSSQKKDTGRRTGDSDQHVQRKVEVRLRATFTTITTGEITTNRTFLRDNRPGGDIGHRAPFTSPTAASITRNTEDEEHGKVLRLSRGKGALHQRLLSSRKAIGDCSRIWKTQSSCQGSGQAQKRKFQKGCRENWMNAPITFPLIPSDDVSDEPLIIEAEVEGYLVMFGSEGLSRRTTMRFTVIQASSPYNIILGRTGMRDLRAISSTTHAMMKFPTPRGIAMLVPRRDPIFECQQLESKHVPPEEKESLTEDVVINPTFPDQRITIGVTPRQGKIGRHHHNTRRQNREN